MKYKIGDKVRVRKDLEVGNYYGSQAFTHQMREYLGKKAIITNNVRSWFNIDIDTRNWLWTPEMLEPAPLYKVGDKVLIKDLTEAYEDDYSFGLTDEMRDRSNTICTIKSINLDPDVKDDEEISYDGYEYMLEEDYGEYTWSSDMFVGSVIKTSSNSTVISQDDPGPRGKLSIITRDDIALATAQAVENIKGLIFKIRDKIIVRDDLIPGKEYDNGCRFVPDMQKYCGKVATIIDWCTTENSIRYHLNIDGIFSWSPSMLLPYTPGSDYDLDIINQQKTIKQNENRLQESDPVISGGKERPGCAICYPGSKTSIGIGHLRDSTTACKC